MNLIDRIEEILNAGFVKEKGSLYVQLYKEAFPLNESLKENCKSCYNLAFERLQYEKNKGYINIMAKTKKQKEETTDTEVEVVFSMRKLIDPANGRVFDDDEQVGIKGVGVLCNATLTESQVTQIINAGQARFLNE